MQEILSIVAGALFFVGYIPYLRSIWRGDTQPSIASWGVWLFLDTLTTITMVSAGQFNGQLLGAVLGALAVFSLSLSKGKRSWGKLDTACTFLATLGITAWLVSGDPVLGLSFSLFATFVAGVPTFFHAWEDPDKENKTAWTIFFASCVLQVSAVSQWDLAGALQPLVFLAINATMAGIVWFRKPPPKG